MEQKIIKAGNSMAVTIPSRFVKSLGLRPGTLVKLETITDTGQLIITFPGSHQLSLTSQFPKAEKNSKIS